MAGMWPGTNLSALLRSYRRRAGLTQAMLAQRAGISTAAVRDLEQCRTHRPQPGTVDALAAALGLDDDDRTALRSSAEGTGSAGSPPVSVPGGPLSIRVLGPVTVHAGPAELPLGRGKRLAVLTRLTLTPNRTVSDDELTELFWAGYDRSSAANVIQACMSRIRATLSTAVRPQTLRRVPRGYRLELDEDQLDLLAFAHLMRLATAAGTEPGTALEHAENALLTWRGDAVADVPELQQHPLVTALEEARIAAVVRHADLAHHQHQPERALPWLRDSAARHPLHELLHARLITCLAATGRRAVALDAYAGLRRRLADDLGIDPGTELVEAHLAVLRGPKTARQPAVPAEIPAGPRFFAGREAQLRELDLLLTGPPGPSVAVLSGTAGVGKTALAVHWARLMQHRFPDGLLYVNLRGFDAGRRVTAPRTAVRGFLDALGVPPDRLPATVDAQTALYRTLVAGKKILVLLDNARDAEQVRPLLPGPAAVTLVTSRDQLAGLVAVDGAHPLTLDLLPAVEARDLLGQRLGQGRVAAEPGAVDQIVSACARLPLALSIIAARAQQTGFPLSRLAAELASTDSRLDVLDTGDAASQVWAVFSWSYRTLSPAAATLFRLLGLHPGPQISLPAAASLMGQPGPEVRRLLSALTRASMLVEHLPDRYTFHDLLRAYAAGLTRTRDDHSARRAATTRLFDHYTHSAHHAGRLLDPLLDPILVPLAPAAATVSPERAADHDEAMAWFATEHPVLLTVADQAATTGFDTHAWQLAWSVNTFLYRRARWDDQTAVWHAALLAARRLEDPMAQAYAHRCLGRAHTTLSRETEAHEHLQSALKLHAGIGDRVGEAHTHRQIATMWGRQNRPDSALRHAQQAFALYQDAGHLRGQADALNQDGWYRALLGDHTEAVASCERSLALFQQLGDRDGQAYTLDSLGYALRAAGQHARAADCYQQALVLFREIGDRFLEVGTLTNIGDSHDTAGDHGAARAAWSQALRVLTDVEHPDADTLRTNLKTRLA